MKLTVSIKQWKASESSVAGKHFISSNEVGVKKMTLPTSLPSDFDFFNETRVVSNTTVQNHHLFSTQPSLWSNSHIHT